MQPSEMDAVLLCGGRGTRLEPVTGADPKVMVDIHGRPFLARLVEHLRSRGFGRVILCTGYQGDRIREYFHRKPDPGILFSQEKRPLGTAGALKLAEGLFRSNPIFVMNGDSFCELDYGALLGFHERSDALATVVATEAKGRRDAGFLNLDEQGHVLSFRERGQADGGYMSAGIYLFSLELLQRIPSERCLSLEEDILPLLRKDDFRAFLSEAGIYDIGTPERLEAFRKAGLPRESPR